MAASRVEKQQKMMRTSGWDSSKMRASRTAIPVAGSIG